MSLWVAIVVLSILLLAASLLLLRATRRLLQFDEIFSYLVDDIQVNLEYFEKLANTTLVSNAPEVVQVHKNMQIMGQRLGEFVRRMGEVTLLEEAYKRRKQERLDRMRVSHNPPSVV